MNALTKSIILLVAIFGLGIGLLVWKTRAASHGTALNTISKEEMELLIKDAPPMVRKTFAEDPERKKQQLKGLTEMLALAVAAQKEGLGADAEIQNQMATVRDELLATAYDREINAEKGPMPAFGYISEDQVKDFWGASAANAEQPAVAPNAESNTPAQPAVANESIIDKIKGIFTNSTGRVHEAEFQKFINSKLAMAKAAMQGKDHEISEEEMKQARDYFARYSIYAEEAKGKIAEGKRSSDENERKRWENFERKFELQYKLQTAQTLAGAYSEKLAEKLKPTEEEIKKYTEEHPELSPATKKAKAEEILGKAKSGEDFAKLANEFSEDPGNKNPKGETQGGLYKDVPQGQMVPEFEAAALALQPGQVAENLVETKYGFHIIKLEKRADEKDEQGNAKAKYDVRHILISTAVKDPEQPMGREVPVSDYVEQKLAKEKRDKFFETVIAENNISVAEDFDIPQPTQEELDKMMKQQMPQMQGEPGAPPAPKGAKQPAAHSEDDGHGH